MNWDEVKQDVEAAGGIKTYTMETLRNTVGAGKLGVHVRTEISKTLAGLGLGHVPQQLPTNQHEQVRLYKRGTDVGDFLETALTPGPANDEKILARFSDSGTDYATIIETIRELVAG